MIQFILPTIILLQSPQSETKVPPLPSGNSTEAIETRLHYIVNLERARDWDGLEALCLNWLKTEPNDPSAWFGIGNAYLGRVQYAKAVAAYRRAIEYKPDMWRAWVNLGFSYHGLHDQNGVAECLRELHKIDPAIARTFRRKVTGLS